MNEERRKKLTQAKDDLLKAQGVIQEIQGEEQETFDNMPEGFQQGERGQKVEAAIDALGEADDAITNAIDYLDTATE